MSTLVDAFSAQEPTEEEEDNTSLTEFMKLQREPEPSVIVDTFTDTNTEITQEPTEEVSKLPITREAGVITDHLLGLFHPGIRTDQIIGAPGGVKERIFFLPDGETVPRWREPDDVSEMSLDDVLSLHTKLVRSDVAAEEIEKKKSFEEMVYAVSNKIEPVAGWLAAIPARTVLSITDTIREAQDLSTWQNLWDRTVEEMSRSLTVGMNMRQWMENNPEHTEKELLRYLKDYYTLVDYTDKFEENNFLMPEENIQRLRAQQAAADKFQAEQVVEKGFKEFGPVGGEALRWGVGATNAAESFLPLWLVFKKLGKANLSPGGRMVATAATMFWISEGNTEQKLKTAGMTSLFRLGNELFAGQFMSKLGTIAANYAWDTVVGSPYFLSIMSNKNIPPQEKWRLGVMEVGMNIMWAALGSTSKTDLWKQHQKYIVEAADYMSPASLKRISDAPPLKHMEVFYEEDAKYRADPESTYSPEMQEMMGLVKKGQKQRGVERGEIKKRLKEGVPFDEKTVNKTVSLFPERITDQASLEKVGNAIAEHVGIERKVAWTFGRSKKETHAIHYDLHNPNNSRRAKRFPGFDSHIHMSLAVGSPVTVDVDLSTPRFAGLMFREKGEKFAPGSQGELKRMLVHELGHGKVLPFRSEEGGRRVIHTEDFKEFVEGGVSKLTETTTTTTRTVAPGFEKFDELNLTAEENGNLKRLYRGRIRAVMEERGISQKKYHGIVKSLIGKTSDKRASVWELDNLWRRVKTELPTKVGSERVATAKQTRRILKLFTTYSEENGMSEVDMKEIASSIGVDTLVFNNTKSFLSSDKADELVHMMHLAAPVLQERNLVHQASLAHPALAFEIKSLGKAIKWRLDPDAAKKVGAFQGTFEYSQKLEEVSSVPMYDSFFRAMRGVNKVKALEMEASHEIVRAAGGKRRFQAIVNDPDAMKRLEVAIESRSALKRGEHPVEELTDDERAVALRIGAYYDDIKDWTALARFHYFRAQGVEPKGVSKKDLRRATDAYLDGGDERVIEVIRGQEGWVKAEDYAPRPKHRTPKIRARVGVERLLSTEPLHNRLPDQDFSLGLETTVLHEFHRRLKTAWNRQYVATHLDRLFAMYNNNVDLFDQKAQPQIRLAIEQFADAALGHRSPVESNEKVLMWLNMAASSVAFTSAKKGARNLIQNEVISPHPERLYDPRNKPMTKEDVTFFRVNVSQKRSAKMQILMGEYSTQVKNPLVDTYLKGLDISRAMSTLPPTDEVNRIRLFWAELNAAKRIFTGLDLDDHTALREGIEELDMSILRPIEQKRLLEVLAVKDVESFAEEWGAEVVRKVHFSYAREQRGPSEYGEKGRMTSHLRSFPRSYANLLWDQLEQSTNPHITKKERSRKQRYVMSVLGRGALIGGTVGPMIGYSRNPYNPVNILSGVLPLGLATVFLESSTGMVSNIVRGLTEKNEGVLDFGLDALGRLVDLYGPFHDIIVTGLGGMFGKENLDRLLIDMGRERLSTAASGHFKADARKHTVTRTWAEAIRYGVFGGRADIKETEHEKLFNESQQRKQSWYRAFKVSVENHKLDQALKVLSDSKLESNGIGLWITEAQARRMVANGFITPDVEKRYRQLTREPDPFELGYVVQKLKAQGKLKEKEKN